MDKRMAVRTEQEIVGLCDRGLHSRTLRIETLRRLRKVIPLDSFWFATADPATLLFTSSVVEDIPEHATPAFAVNEVLQDDVNTWVQFARASRPANELYLATRGKPDRSPRYLEILAPLGFGDELRAALLAGGAGGVMVRWSAQHSPRLPSPRASVFTAQWVPGRVQGRLLTPLRQQPGSRDRPAERAG